MSQYDFLIVGAGLYGASFARLATDGGYKCLVIDRRAQVAGNVYTENVGGINVHKYGAHIFHTSDREVWDFANRFAEFNRYTNTVVANYKGEIYSMPFNMYTFNKMWGVITPEEARKKLDEQIASVKIDEPKNLEEQALSLIGPDIYTKLIKGYTEKQWGRKATELPAFIIKRLPVRLTYNNNYFNDDFQGIPVGGYTGIVEKLLGDIPVELGVDFKKAVKEIPAESGEGTVFEMNGNTFDKVLYTGMIDEFFDDCYGPLEYRSLRFESEELPEVDNFQGNAVVNYTEREVPFTRIIEHKFFEFGKDSETGEPIKGTIITREYPATWEKGMEPYYPVNNDRNNEVYEKYHALALNKKNVLFGGRLGLYKYFDMDKVIRASLDAAAQELG